MLLLNLFGDHGATRVASLVAKAQGLGGQNSAEWQSLCLYRRRPLDSKMRASSIPVKRVERSWSMTSLIKVTMNVMDKLVVTLRSSRHDDSIFPSEPLDPGSS